MGTQSAGFFKVKHSRHVSVADTVFHKYLAVELLVAVGVPEESVTFGEVGFGHDVGIVEDTEGTPHIRHEVVAHFLRFAHAGNVDRGEYFVDLRIDHIVHVDVVGNFALVELLDEPFLHEALYGVLGGADEVDGLFALLKVGKHYFVGVEHGIYHFDRFTGGFGVIDFEAVDNAFVDVIAPVVNDELFVRRRFFGRGAGGKDNACEHCAYHSENKRDTTCFFHSFSPFPFRPSYRNANLLSIPPLPRRQ